MAYPNVSSWSALQRGHSTPARDGSTYPLTIVDCGPLVMPTGKLVACDPFVFHGGDTQPAIEVPAGIYPVHVTIADVSGEGDGSHLRAAYATLLLDMQSEEAARRIITPTHDEPCPPEMTGDGTYYGIPVDTGTACFMDRGAAAALLPTGDVYTTVFDNGTDNSWFSRMDDPDHIMNGLANIPLPGAMKGENIVIFHSGWGDGYYPVVGGYDAAGNLVRVHLDFMVVFDFGDE